MFEKLAESISAEEYLKDKELQQLLEYKLAARPVLEYVRQVSPNTKITIVDASDYTIEQYTSLSNYHNIVGKDKHLPALSQKLFMTKPFIYQYYTNLHVFSNVKLGRSVCLVRGFEKPILIVEKPNRVLALFSDIVMSGTNNLGNKEYAIENFYWSIDAPFITVKQCQLIKDKLETDKKFFMLYHSSKKKIEEHNDPFRNSPAFMIERELSSIIYPDFNIKTFAAAKILS